MPTKPLILFWTVFHLYRRTKPNMYYGAITLLLITLGQTKFAGLFSWDGTGMVHERHFANTTGSTLGQWQCKRALFPLEALRLADTWAKCPIICINNNPHVLPVSETRFYFILCTLWQRSDRRNYEGTQAVATVAGKNPGFNGNRTHDFRDTGAISHWRLPLLADAKPSSLVRPYVRERRTAVNPGKGWNIMIVSCKTSLVRSVVIPRIYIRYGISCNFARYRNS